MPPVTIEAPQSAWGTNTLFSFIEVNSNSSSWAELYREPDARFSAVQAEGS